DATEMRRRVLLAFEAAERETDPDEIQKWLTFVIVGGGPTGVELSGAVGEIANYTLKHNFRRIDPTHARIILLEGTDRILPSYPADLSARAAESLRKLGVTVHTGAMVTDIHAESLTYRENNQTQTISARTILWGAGVLASPLGRKLAEATGAELDRAERIVVQ